MWCCEQKSFILKMFISTLTLLSLLPGKYCRDSGSVAGDFEWNVAIGVNRSDGFQFLCGGVLVSPRKVVTSASCFDSESGIGSSDADSIEIVIMDSSSQFHSVKEITGHPKYTTGNFYDDVAVLKLLKPLKDHETAALLTFSYSSELNLDDKGYHIISNWLLTSSESPSTEILPGNLIPNDVCEESYRKYLSKKSLQFDTVFPRGINSALICAQLIGLPECLPESAYQIVTPLIEQVYDVKGFEGIETDFLIGTRFKGILKDVNGCEDFELPAIFTNVGQHKKWITNI